MSTGAGSGLEVEKLGDKDLQHLMEQLASEVRERQEEVQTLRTQVEEMQVEIQKTQQQRAEFAKRSYKVEEISPLVEQCEQVRRALEERQRRLESLGNTGTAAQCSDVRELEVQLSNAESGSELAEMETRNKENLYSLEKVGLELKEQGELDVQLTQLHSKVAELRKQQDHREPTHTSMDAKLEKFLRKACKESGLQLPNTDKTVLRKQTQHKN